MGLMVVVTRVELIKMTKGTSVHVKHEEELLFHVLKAEDDSNAVLSALKTKMEGGVALMERK